MTPTLPFQELIRRVRAREPQASAEVVRLFEPEIRRFVRVKMLAAADRWFFDSVDICQSVLGNFFIRVVAGQFDLAEPQRLLSLLFRMAENKLFDHQRRHAAERAQIVDPSLWDELTADCNNADDALCYQELLEKASRLLSDEERQLADRRAQGREWKEIADELGGSPDALRKQLARGFRRVCAQLGLSAVSYE